jgi:glucosamine 6-phosphate synthetase-like amidotransferase/phosphosugar isomerase protein
MCGIIGAIGKNIDSDIVHDLFLATQPRGKEATGFWTATTGTIKKDKGADKFLNKRTLKKLNKGIKESDILLGHCRYATHGKPEFNYNNHPIESENWIIVHNGVVNIKDFDDYEYVSDTDTENIVAYIERFGLVEGLAKISSGASIILKNKAEDDCIYVWRTATGDLLLALDVDHDTLYVCSGEKYMKPESERP